MRVIRLKKHQTDFFLGLDPFEMLKPQEEQEEGMLGAVTDVPGRDGDVPAGLLLYRADGDRLILNWLYVAPDFRREGVGERLLAAAFAIARHEGLREVRAALREDLYGWSVICADARIFLKTHFFKEDPLANDGTLTASIDDFYADYERGVLAMASFELLFASLDEGEEDEPDAPAEETAEGTDASFVRAITKNDRVVRVRDLCGNDTLMQGKKPPAVRSLGDLTLIQLAQGLETCLKARPAQTFPEDLASLPFTWFDPEISACAVEDGRVTGLFLIHPDKNGLWAEYLCATGSHRDAHLLGMLRFSARRAGERCREDRKVILRPGDARVQALINRVMGS